jgi:hypothetical protein
MHSKWNARLKNPDPMVNTFLAEYGSGRGSEIHGQFQLEYITDPTREHIPPGMESGGWDAHRNAFQAESMLSRIGGVQSIPSGI